ncbi:cadherin repeat domain-containing protein [Planktomarina temperata]|nr:cadherin repeat domain-containing protein [Planktomarina temperata]MDB2454964.1 cadherin repeat domain-containing protein [Planktomarina temperata]
MTNYKTVRFYSPLGLLALAACGGSSGGSGGGAARVFDINGNLIKGPLKGAIAFIDTNGNNLPDAGETQIETDAFGFYTLSSGSATSRVVAVTGPGTVDMSSGAVVAEMTLSAPAGATVITPLTTLIDGSSDLSVEELQASLGLTVNPLEFNPFADGVDADQAVAAEKAAQQIATVLTTVTAIGGGDASAFGETVKAIAAKFDNQTTVVDMTASSFVGDVLDTAVAAVNAASTGTPDIVISAANKATLTASVVNVNKILEDTLVSGVNLSSSAIKNALATVSQFTESVAAIDDFTVNTAISTGGFDDLETVKTALANTAPTDISLSANVIKSDIGSGTIAKATALDGENTKIVFSIANGGDGEDGSFFTIDQDNGNITLKSGVAGYDAKTSFSVVIKATDYTDNTLGGNNTFDSGDVKGKSFAETFVLTKQDPGAFGLSNSMTLNDWDNSDPNSLVADATALEGSVTNGILKVGSDPVKLNLKNIDAFANGTGGKAPSLSLVLDTVPTTNGTKTANINIQILDGANSSADTGERVISLDMELKYSGDGTIASLTIPNQTATGFYTNSSGEKTTLEIINGTSDILVLTGGVVGIPTTLDLKVANLVKLAKEQASVDLLKAGEYNVLVTIMDGLDGLKIQAGDGSGTITGIEMGLSIVDETEIFQLSDNSITVTSDDSSEEKVETEASGGVLAAKTAIEIEESYAKSAYSGGSSLPSLSFNLGKIANSDATAKVKLSIFDGNNATVDTGERSISLDLNMVWDASESNFTLAEGNITGKATTSSGLELDSITLNNADADVLSISTGANGVSGSSLTVKMSGLIDVADEYVSLDLLSKGNYTLQVEVVSGIELYDVSGEAIDKISAVVAVVDDAPLDISLTATSVNENDTNGSISLSSSFNGNGLSSGVTYSIIDDDDDANNNPFKIVGTNLVVDKVAQLDHETSSTIDVKIKADTSDRTGTETFTVNINDVNEVPVAPTDLAFSIGAGALSGQATGYTFTATDEDEGSSLTYSMPTNTYFAIDSATGVISANSTLVNGTGVQNLVISFTDGIGATQSATVAATIEDNVAPTVTNADADLKASVDEDAAADTAIFTITGTDGPSSPAVTYGISGNDKFDVDATTGVVTLKAAGTLDHETATSTSSTGTETFLIYAIDDQNAQSATKEVVVTVNDANDAPVFSAGATATGNSLNETALVGATAYTSNLSDADVPSDTITYSLSGTDASSFTVSSSGVVTLNAALDHETKDTYTFALDASDGAGGTASIAVTGAVTDRDDSPFSVETTQSGGNVTVTVSADVDLLEADYASYDAIDFARFIFKLEDGSKLSDSITFVQKDFADYTGGQYMSALAGEASHDVGIGPSNPPAVALVDRASTADETASTAYKSTNTSAEILSFTFTPDSSLSGSTKIFVTGQYQLGDSDPDSSAALADELLTLDPFVFTVDIA